MHRWSNTRMYIQNIYNLYVGYVRIHLLCICVVQYYCTNLCVQYVAYNDTISRHIEGGLTRATVAFLHRRPGQRLLNM